MRKTYILFVRPKVIIKLAYNYVLFKHFPPITKLDKLLSVLVCVFIIVIINLIFNPHYHNDQ